MSALTKRGKQTFALRLTVIDSKVTGPERVRS